MVRSIKQIETFRLCDYDNDFDSYICNINEFLDEKAERVEDIRFCENDNFSTCYITWFYTLIDNTKYK